MGTHRYKKISLTSKVIEGHKESLLTLKTIEFFKMQLAKYICSKVWARICLTIQIVYIF